MDTRPYLLEGSSMFLSNLNQLPLVYILVVDTDFYDLVIGIDWLMKVNVTIDTNAMKIYIKI